MSKAPDDEIQRALADLRDVMLHSELPERYWANLLDPAWLLLPSKTKNVEGTRDER